MASSLTATASSLSRTTATALLSKVQRGLSPLELVYVPHDNWLPQRPRISILDASFNPPTIAHLALATTPASTAADARLFLLSVRNADKVLKPGDATHLQRLDMMLLLARRHRAAVALIDEPTFAGKARVLCTAFPGASVTFLLGFDTLERVLAPRYYGGEALMAAALDTFFSPAQDNARIVCARRGAVSPESQTLARAERFVADGRIELVDIGEAEQTYSSTAVRDAIARGDDSWKQLVTPDIAEYIMGEKLYVAVNE
ncbi:hypothetical protein B0H15DRAFT_154271 [Mycena belliarum]|uniref:Nicotinamide-nucleotide adenylyltransferase n=1 Tax=Mycena belliarum TaxID=1033014 RepID=A0AAD6TM11_9AGAR|nr:hypothetical protein B0H15DRAFT_154271 [Mycena belliae]